MAPRETEDNAYAKFWSDEQKSIMVCYGISGVVNWWTFLTMNITTICCDKV